MTAAVLVLILVPNPALCMRSTTGRPDGGGVVAPPVPYYTRLDDVNPGNVPELRLGFSLDLHGFSLGIQTFGYVETPDGLLVATTAEAGSVGVIALIREISGGVLGPTVRSRADAIAGIAQASADTHAAAIVDTARVSSSATWEMREPRNRVVPVVRKVGHAGDLLWERVFYYQTRSGRVNNIAVHPDGGFVFTVQTHPYPRYDRYVYEPILIVKCDKDGNEQWRQYLDDYDRDVARALLVAEDGQVFVVGNWRSEDGRQVAEYGIGDIDVVITKLAKDGTIIEQRSYGGSDDDEIYRAGYLKGVGLILLGGTASGDGEFVGIRTSEQSGAGGTGGNRFVACVGPDLDIRWVCPSAPDEGFSAIAVGNDSVYVLGSRSEAESGTSRPRLLVKLDAAGNRVWTRTNLYDGHYDRALAVLESGRIVVTAERQPNQGLMLVFDDAGAEVGRFTDLGMAPDMIKPTTDGGFILTAERNIRAIPQPPFKFISLIWMDTECVAAKYGPDLILEWRKTFDRYKGERGTDIVLPLCSGGVVVVF